MTVDTPLEGADLAKAIALVRQAIVEVDQAVYYQYNKGTSVWDDLKIGFENAATLWAFSDIRARVWDQYTSTVQDWELQKRAWIEVLDRGTLANGSPITVAWCMKAVTQIKKIPERLRQILNIVDEYGRGTVFTNKVLGKMAASASERMNQANEALDALLKALLSILQATASVLPWAILVLIFGPFLLRSFVAWRRGGATAAAEAAASSIEAGRANVWEGTKRAASAAKFLI